MSRNFKKPKFINAGTTKLLNGGCCVAPQLFLERRSEWIGGCDNCHTTLQHENKEKLIEEWNTRFPKTED